ncbi:MAG: alkaline phosphatase D family protein [Alphaproteobacteria bacterium]|nr:alkaline phosphatase D family protein [Alphaproteobacteria bacterium]
MHDLSRRRLLHQTAAFSSIPLLGSLAACGTTFPSDPQIDGRLFSLGVASGEPWPESVVIWTRLARHPLNGGGMPDLPIAVRWEVATDDRMRNIVRKGIATALPKDGHAVHVEVQGLLPHRWYWYRFSAEGEESQIGRTRTAPAAGQRLEALRLAFASCQNYERGYFTAYRHMASEDLDLVLHLGDYIYEGGSHDRRPRRHNSGEVTTLAEYRDRYALYKLDPNLQSAHAAFPWAVVSDDHEVDNNYANDLENNLSVSPAEFLKRRAAAYKAYYEHMPLRRAAAPRGPDMQLYRTLLFGDLAAIHLLDTRQYRSDQPNKDTAGLGDDRHGDPRATMLGPKQEAWLYANLAKRDHVWNVLAQQVPMMQRRRPRANGTRYELDQWDGYPAARRRLTDAIRKSATQGVIVLSGDEHENWVSDLKANFDDPTSPTVGAEFVGTSISSGGNGYRTTRQFQRVIAANPHIKYHNGRRGYVRCTVGRETWRTDLRVMPYVTRPGAPIRTPASFVVKRRMLNPLQV